jgi:uncharacterized protein with PIN domain
VNGKDEIKVPGEMGKPSLLLGPGHHMPNRCPECGAAGALRLIKTDTEGITEGQEADHEAGLSGFAFCRACERNVFWQV